MTKAPHGAFLLIERFFFVRGGFERISPRLSPLVVVAGRQKKKEMARMGLHVPWVYTRLHCVRYA